MIHTNIDLEKSLLDGDRRTAYVELGKYSGLSHGNLQRLVHEELGMKKVCASWVARPLTGKRRQNCFDLCAMKLYYVN